jgi:hypothetical protein
MLGSFSIPIPSFNVGGPKKSVVNFQNTIDFALANPHKLFFSLVQHQLDLLS